MLQRLCASIAALLLACASLRAQTGTVDQVSPGANASFNLDAASLVWQVEVQAGLAGQLEGVELDLTGSAGSSFALRLRSGPGWNSTAPLLQVNVTQSAAGGPQFVNLQAANLNVTPGALFVVEVQGNGSGGSLRGSYVPPPSGAPLYPRPLFLGGPGCFADCGWRIGFRTFVRSTQPFSTYCTSGTSTAGCVASIQGVGVPSASFSTPFSVHVSNVEGQKTGIIFYGLGALPQPWCSPGSSFLCVKAPTQRTLASSSGGAIAQCNGSLSVDWNAFHAANPGAFGTPFSAGHKVYVQAWFRDPPACKTTSLTNALEVTLQ